MTLCKLTKASAMYKLSRYRRAAKIFFNNIDSRRILRISILYIDQLLNFNIFSRQMLNLYLVPRMS